eukprot:3157788-Prymnesium_polylepis.1
MGAGGGRLAAAAGAQRGRADRRAVRIEHHRVRPQDGGGRRVVPKGRLAGVPERRVVSDVQRQGAGRAHDRGEREGVRARRARRRAIPLRDDRAQDDSAAQVVRRGARAWVVVGARAGRERAAQT